MHLFTTLETVGGDLGVERVLSFGVEGVLPILVGTELLCDTFSIFTTT